MVWLLWRYGDGLVSVGIQGRSGFCGDAGLVAMEIRGRSGCKGDNGESLVAIAMHQSVGQLQEVSGVSAGTAVVTRNW